MLNLLKTKSIYYDDVNLIAQPGKVKSRSEINIEGKRIIIAPMTSVIGDKFVEACINLPEQIKPTLCIPRVKNASDFIIKSHDKLDIIVSIGLDDPSLEELAINYQLPVLIDVANGYLPQLYKKIEQLKERVPHIMAGNVHTKEGAENLIKAGADLIRVGIANGAACTTRFATGINRGQITELSEIFELYGYYDNFDIIADGGIRYAADIVKAFGAGADLVMCGGIFAKCKEAENIVKKQFKYYGMASDLGKNDMDASDHYIEGTTIELGEKLYPKLQDVIYSLWDGIRSGISYSGYTSLNDFSGFGTFELKCNT